RHSRQHQPGGSGDHSAQSRHPTNSDRTPWTASSRGGESRPHLASVQGTAVKLRLGPVPDTSVAKLAVAIPAPLMIQLQRYAQLHSQNFGTAVEPSVLIPMILALFLKKDREFQRALRQEQKSL